MGDYSEQSPDENQFQALISLVRYLQQQCNIDADSVYLRSQLPGEVDLPGRAFPVGRFNSSLFRTTPH
jgi:hypothetical protein